MAKSKTGKTLRRLKYIEVEGVDKVYLDACLLAHFNLGQLCEALEDEKTLLAKTNLTIWKLKKGEVTKQELIRKVSPHINSNYRLYNFFANINSEMLRLSEERFENFSSLSLEEKADYLDGLVQKGEMSYSIYITWLRFHELLHHRIPKVLEEYGEKFEEETGIKLPPSFEIKREAKEGEQMKEGLYGELTNIIQTLMDIRDRVKQESFRDQYEEKKREVEMLQEQLKRMETQLGSKEKQLAKQMKETSTLLKKLEEEKQKVKQKQKEAGQLGQEIGKLRLQVEELERENQLLKREVESKNKKMEVITKEIEERSENRWKLEKVKLQQTYEERIVQLEETVRQLEVQLETSLRDFERERIAYQDESTALRQQVELYEQMINNLQSQQQSCNNEKSILVDSEGEQTQNDEWFDRFFGDLPVNKPEEV